MGLSSTEIIIIGVVSGLVVAILVYLILRSRRKIRRQFSGELERDLGREGQFSEDTRSAGGGTFDVAGRSYYRIPIQS